MLKDTVNAFSEILDPSWTGGESGPLSGLSFAVKDNYDLSGRVAGNGNPTWKASHSPSQHTAPVILDLLRAGAELVGVTHMDELAYSMIGKNAHSGTPRNTSAPKRVPGGSSSGSAAAVAAGLVDFAMGSDTGGSVRVPASFCGLWGIRPTHGRLECSGVAPLARSFDVPGWFSRDLATLRAVSAVLGVSSEGFSGEVDLWMPENVWNRHSGPTRDAVSAAVSKLEETCGPGRRDPLPGPPAGQRFEIFRVHQAFEIWRELGAWISKYQPDFGPGVAERFRMAAAVTPADFDKAHREKLWFRDELKSAMGSRTVLVMPTTPGPAPLVEDSEAALASYRAQAMEISCISGLSGFPEVTIPGAMVAGAPVGLSLLGTTGSENLLLNVAQCLAD